MKNKKYILFLTFIIFLGTAANLNALALFSGYAGGKINLGGNTESSEYDPDLKLQAFFSGQFNFNDNMWGHAEISIDTDDFISSSIFSATPSKFQIDELSFIMKKPFDTLVNYFSTYMGIYDPIGSDIFLRRYFGITPISSKITESYLGLSGSVLYPHFGFGVSDVLKFYQNPIALGGYVYINKEKQINGTETAQSDEKSISILNTDLRFACVFQYFNLDLALGVGLPLGSEEEHEDLIIAIDKLYWHFGATLLIGNKYTTSLFIQTGFNGTFTSPPQTSPDKMYLLIEPRFIIKSFDLNISLFSLPKDTVDKILLLDDGLGLDVNLYNDEIIINDNFFTIGGHLNFSIKNKTMLDLGDKGFLEDGISINLTPYVSTELFSGEVHAQFSIKFMEFAKNFGNAFSMDLGYRTRF